VEAVATPEYDISPDVDAPFRVDFSNAHRADATQVQVTLVRESKPNLVAIQQMILASFQTMEELTVVEASLSVVNKTAKSEMYCTGPSGQIPEGEWEGIRTKLMEGCGYVGPRDVETRTASTMPLIYGAVAKQEVARLSARVDKELSPLEAMMAAAAQKAPQAAEAAGADSVVRTHEAAAKVAIAAAETLELAAAEMAAAAANLSYSERRVADAAARRADSSAQKQLALERASNSAAEATLMSGITSAAKQAMRDGSEEEFRLLSGAAEALVDKDDTRTPSEASKVAESEADAAARAAEEAVQAWEQAENELRIAESARIDAAAALERKMAAMEAALAARALSTGKVQRSMTLESTEEMKKKKEQKKSGFFSLLPTFAPLPEILIERGDKADFSPPPPPPPPQLEVIEDVVETVEEPPAVQEPPEKKVEEQMGPDDVIVADMQLAPEVAEKIAEERITDSVAEPPVQMPPFTVPEPPRVVEEPPVQPTFPEDRRATLQTEFYGHRGAVQVDSGLGCGSGEEVLLQAFNWESCREGGGWYNRLMRELDTFVDQGFTGIWTPPPTASVSDEGYMPTDLYDLNSRFGSESELRRMLQEAKDRGLLTIGDIVINHRCATYHDDYGRWNRFGGKLDWGPWAICPENPQFGGTGNRGTGEDYGPAPNIDHTNEKVRSDLKEWLQWMQYDVGYQGWRFDFVKGFAGEFCRDYIESTTPEIAFGEWWDACNYSDGVLNYDQDSHRQRTIDWCDRSAAGAFDFTTKGILQEAVSRNEYWRLVDKMGRPPGAMGLWGARAVTFLENHDTGSTLGHWRFPWEKVLEGYAYILTHPGTPCVFYDHLMDANLKHYIVDMVKLRKFVRIHARSTVVNMARQADLYAAVIDDVMAVKIGPGNWSPNSAAVLGAKWDRQVDGPGFAIWIRER